MPPDLDRLLGEARALNQRYQDGGRDSIDAFSELVQFLFSLTISTSGAGLKLQYGPRRPIDFAVLTGRLGDGLVRLQDGRFLKLSIQLFLDPDTDRLKVTKSVYQYQARENDQSWIVRYEYIRTPTDQHPGMHLHVRGVLLERDVLAPDWPLERIHFPTDRVSCEAVIRLLIEQFHVPSRENASIWRPVLAATEEAFTRIAHRAPSGPSH